VITLVLSAVIVFGMATLGLAVGVMFNKRGLRGPCCGGRTAAGHDGQDSTCLSCSEEGKQERFVQLSIGNLKRE